MKMKKCLMKEWMRMNRLKMTMKSYKIVRSVKIQTKKTAAI